MNEEQIKEELNRVKQYCDFIMDQTGTVKFEITGEECLCMINSLTYLAEVAQLRLQNIISSKGKKCLKMPI